MTFPLLELGGPADGPLLHLAPANSFPVPTYSPVYSAWSDRYRIVSVPPQGLRPNPGPPPSTRTGWEDLGENLAAAIEHHDFEGVVAVGHSFGAVASLVAAARHPARFRALCLLDPTMLMPEQLEWIYHRDPGGKRHHRLAIKARERRTEFGSEGEAYTFWRRKRLFHDWSDEILRLFVRTALRPATSGSGLTLAWPADWEAHYYEGLYPESWTDLERLDPRIRVLVVRGGDTDTFTSAAAERFRAIRPSATMVDIAGYGHLFPQAAPEQTGRIVAEWLGGLEG